MIAITLSHIIILYFSGSNLMLLLSFDYHGSPPPPLLTFEILKNIIHSFNHLPLLEHL